MEGNSDLWCKFGARDEGGSKQELVIAVHCPHEGIEGKINRELLPRGLLHGAEASLGRAAQKDALGRAELEETAITEAGNIETKAAEIVVEEDRAADIRIDGVAVGVGKGQPESERSELVHVGHKTPAILPEGL